MKQLVVKSRTLTIRGLRPDRLAARIALFSSTLERVIWLQMMSLFAYIAQMVTSMVFPADLVNDVM